MMNVGKWKAGVTAKRWSQSAIPETRRLRNSDLTYSPQTLGRAKVASLKNQYACNGPQHDQPTFFIPHKHRSH